MQIEGISAEISLIRSSRRSLAAEIMPDGSVKVRAPQRMPEQQIIRMAESAASVGGGRIGVVRRLDANDIAAIYRAAL